MPSIRCQGHVVGHRSLRVSASHFNEQPSGRGHDEKSRPDPPYPVMFWEYLSSRIGSALESHMAQGTRFDYSILKQTPWSAAPTLSIAPHVLNITCLSKQQGWFGKDTHGP